MISLKTARTYGKIVPVIFIPILAVLCSIILTPLYANATPIWPDGLSTTGQYDYTLLGANFFNEATNRGYTNGQDYIIFGTQNNADNVYIMWNNDIKWISEGINYTTCGGSYSFVLGAGQTVICATVPGGGVMRYQSATNTYSSMNAYAEFYSESKPYFNGDTTSIAMTHGIQSLGATTNSYPSNDTPPVVYYPNRPVISYSIKGKTLDLDCHLSTFFAPNDASFTNCQFFIDKDSGDTDNLNLTQFTGTDATATVTNMLNLNVISDNHIANMTTCFDSQICPTEEQTHFQYTFEDYGKYYIKLAIQNDTEDGYISAVDRTIVIDGTNFEGDTENGTVVPDIYETCPDFLSDAGGFITCTIKNFGTSIITAISDFFTFLFTPTTPIADLWSDFFDTLSEKLGFLSYPFTFIGSLATSISNATTADCTLTFGTILDGQPVNYDFCQFEDHLPTFFDFFQMILIGGTTLLLISGLMGKFKEITST